MARHSVVARHKRSERAIEVRPTLSVRKGGWQSGGILHEPRRIRRSALQAQISARLFHTLVSPSVRFCMCTQNSHKSISPSRSMSSCG